MQETKARRNPPAAAGGHVKSKQRVADHGEVFTPAWMVEAMLDLVKPETEQIDARFLEPACGSGNFLVPVLRRKLATVQQKYGKSDFEMRHQALYALGSIYGIELLSDNIAECHANLLEVFADEMEVEEADVLYRAASYVLSQNLIHGDALRMLTQDGEHIVFASWGYLKGKYQRRDFALKSLATAEQQKKDAAFFGPQGTHEVFTPVREYPRMTMRELAAMAFREPEEAV
ncbi:MAG: SAM-dependent DNA methyltransferase [Dehalococcoidia bacterium]|nr:SAM-dependent DNA methyltransferase [Dehalococcoidia bacterium]